MVAVLTNPGVHQKRLRYCHARDEWGFGKQSTAALNRSALVAAAADAATSGRQLYLGRGTVAIDDQVAIASGIDVFGEGDSTELIVSGANKNGLILSGRSRVKISGLRISCDAGATEAYKALIAIINSADVIVEYVSSEGMPWAGVWAQDCKRLRIAHNQFSGVLDTSVPNCGDIVVYRVSDSTLEDNDCTGGGWQGILLQKPDTNVATGNSRNNRIIDNRVSNQSAYGICSYEYMRSNTRNVIARNKVHTISGVNPNGAGGAGIYVMGEGGDTVADNEIWNCCINTANETLTPAGIGVNLRSDDPDDNSIGTIIRGNLIGRMAQYDCIRVTGSGPTHGAVIAGNTLSQHAANGRAIRLINTSSFAITGNVIDSPTSGTPGALIDIQSTTAAVTTGAITGNTMQGGTARGISIYSGGPSVEDVAISGNTVRSTAAGYLGVYLLSAGGITVGDNAVTCAIPLRLENSQNTAVGQNKLRTLATDAIRIVGTCTGSRIASDIVMQGGGINSTATGVGFPLSASTTWDPPSVAAGASVTTTMAVANCGHGDVLEAGFSLDLQGCQISAVPSGPGGALVRITNPTGSAVDLASGTVWVRGRKMA